MDLSLDDIIKSKRISVAPSKKFNSVKRNAPLQRPLRSIHKPVFKEAQRIADARLKIIQKNRAKIRDARDKLAEITRASGDARHRLLRNRQYSVTGASLQHSNYRNGPIRRLVEHKSMPKLYRQTAGGATQGRPRRMQVIEVPRGYVDYDNMERMEEEEYAAASRLSRTVTNDEMDHYPTFGNTLERSAPIRRPNSWNSNSGDHFDPFDVYEVPTNATRHERQVSRISPDHDVPMQTDSKSILRPIARQHSPPVVGIFNRRYMPESTSHLSYEMRSRLENAPDPHASMGIFAKELPTSSSGYRIVVSNLHASVSQSDIMELFSDIGELYDSRIVRPGVAEVIYKSLADAEKAVDTYHNRQLDGLPMKCLLVNPRASSKPTAPAMKTSNSNSTSRAASGKTPLEIDIDALHKVLFRRH